jgi:CSLREA domain-containing protein
LFLNNSFNEEVIPVAKWLLTVLLLCIYISSATTATAVTKYWVGGEGAWTEPSKWSPAGVPAGTDEIRIGYQGPNSLVHLDTSFTFADTWLSVSGTGVLVIDSTLTVDAGVLVVGTSGIVEIPSGGTLIVNSGGTVRCRKTLTVRNQALIHNMGLVEIWAGGVISNSGVVHNDMIWNNQAGSFLVNHGDFQNRTAATVNSAGSFTNYGTLTHNGMGIENTGTLRNFGTMTSNGGLANRNDATIRNEVGAFITNSGFMENSGPTALVDNAGTITLNSPFSNFGIFRNACSGILTGTVTQNPVAECVVWDGGGDGVLWKDPLNWNGDVLPAAIDSVFVDGGAGPDVAVVLDTLAQISSGALTIGAGDTLFIGSPSAGAATVDNAGYIRNHGVALIDTGSTLNNTPWSVPNYTGDSFIQNFGTIVVAVAGGLQNDGDIRNGCDGAVIGPVAGNPVVECSQWDGGGDGQDWFDPFNWTTDALPTDKDVIAIVDSATVTYAQNITIGPFGILTIENGSTIFPVVPSVTLHNGGTIDNGGTVSSFHADGIVNAARFNNTGTVRGHFTNDTEGTFANYERIEIDDSADIFANRGTLRNELYIILMNAGKLSNSGTLSNEVGAMIICSFGGGVENSGTLLNKQAVDVSGWLTNTGLLQNQSGGLIANSGQLTNSGDLRNESGGTIRNDDAGSSDAMLTNAGGLVNEGAITNADSIVNVGTLENKPGGTIEIEDGLAELLNIGDLINDGSVVNISGVLSNAGNFTNNSTLEFNTLANLTGGVLANGPTGQIIPEATLSGNDIVNLSIIRNEGVIGGSALIEINNLGAGEEYCPWDCLMALADAEIENLAGGWIGSFMMIRNAGIITNDCGATLLAPIWLNPALNSCDPVKIVNTTDDIDDGVCDSLHCSLREALAAAATNTDMDTILFDIPGPGPHTIQPESSFVWVPSAVVIDGTTQPGFAGTPIIELDGTNAGVQVIGLRLGLVNATVRGLAINRFGGDGIRAETGSGGLNPSMVGENVIEGNYIGLEPDGITPAGNGRDGIHIVDWTQGRVGGESAGMANRIAHNGGDGVSSSSGVTFSRNLIWANDGIGLDLGHDGVTQNDFGDTDSFQNYPVFSSISVSVDSVTVHGTLHSAADETFKLEFFSNSLCDASIHGEAEHFLAAKTVLTDFAGDAIFTASFPTPLPGGDIVTATATDAQGRTSEFAKCAAPCTVTPSLIDFGPVYVGETKDTTFVIINDGDSTLVGTISEVCAHFSLVPDTPQVYSLTPGNMLTVTVRFEPTSAGTHLSTVETGDSICSDVDLTGIGQCPVIGYVVYVDKDALGANDGSSWTDAFTELREALAVLSLCSPVTEVWVAEGTYTPLDSPDRTATFQLQNGVAIYGGFDGTENSRSKRDWVTHGTILSGDIGAVAVGSDNCYHVVTANGADSTAVLDGFTVTAGWADGTGSERDGAGMYSSGGGGATVTNVVFSGNAASVRGGGMCNFGASPKVANVTFSGNSAQYAGGMYNFDNSATVVNAVFSGNSATVGGGMYNVDTSGNVEIANASFCANLSLLGGGAIYNQNSSLSLVNAILWGDSSTTGANELFNDGTSSSAISYSLVLGGLPAGSIDGGNNIDDDPLFLAAPGDLRLGQGSPAIDAGDDTAPNLPPTDRDGNPRIVGAAVDMGAYEDSLGTATAIPEPVIPEAFALHQNVPNPFNPSTVIQYDVPGAGGKVELRIYDVTGRLVRTLINGTQPPGVHRVTWNAEDNRGDQVATGVYFYRLEAPGFTKTRKMVLLQ